MAYIVKLLSRSTRKNQPKYVSELYKRWLRYLKNNKLFDEYMICMDDLYGRRGTYPTADSYGELWTLTERLYGCMVRIKYRTIVHVNWPQKFKQFVRECSRWWEFYARMKYS